MSETQNIEYKSSWRDEFLRWICGFANAQGGTLYIGKDDNGNMPKSIKFPIEQQDEICPNWQKGNYLKMREIQNQHDIFFHKCPNYVRMMSEVSELKNKI